jgi:hypothetical protein
MNALQPTDVQREKYNKFLSHELKDRDLEFRLLPAVLDFTIDLHLMNLICQFLTILII